MRTYSNFRLTRTRLTWNIAQLGQIPWNGPRLLLTNIFGREGSDLCEIYSTFFLMSVFSYPGQIVLEYIPLVLQLPTIIADNAGYDSAELVAQLRAAHTAGKSTYGLGESRNGGGSFSVELIPSTEIHARNEVKPKKSEIF